MPAGEYFLGVRIRFDFLEIYCLHCLSQATVTMRQLPLCSQVLLLLLGVPSMRRRHASHKAFPKTVKFGGCAPPPMRHRPLRITKCAAGGGG